MSQTEEERDILYATVCYSDNMTLVIWCDKKELCENEIKNYRKRNFKCTEIEELEY